MILIDRCGMDDCDARFRLRTELLRVGRRSEGSQDFLINRSREIRPEEEKCWQN